MCWRFSNVSKLQGLGLKRAETQWCRENGLQFGGDVANAEAASTSWNVKFIQPSMQKQAKTRLFYSEAAKAVAKTAVMVNTVGPWCPKLDFLVMFKPSIQKIYARHCS